MYEITKNIITVANEEGNIITEKQNVTLSFPKTFTPDTCKELTELIQKVYSYRQYCRLYKKHNDFCYDETDTKTWTDDDEKNLALHRALSSAIRPSIPSKYRYWIDLHMLIQFGITDEAIGIVNKGEHKLVIAKNHLSFDASGIYGILNHTANRLLDGELTENERREFNIAMASIIPAFGKPSYTIKPLSTKQIRNVLYSGANTRDKFTQGGIKVGHRVKDIELFKMFAIRCLHLWLGYKVIGEKHSNTGYRIASGENNADLFSKDAFTL